MIGRQRVALKKVPHELISSKFNLCRAKAAGPSRLEKKMRAKSLAAQTRADFLSDLDIPPTGPVTTVRMKYLRVGC
eukprot:SAG31_NODE_5612_length_2424_cov_1.301075_1_plen_75_part_10